MVEIIRSLQIKRAGIAAFKFYGDVVEVEGTVRIRHHRAGAVLDHAHGDGVGGLCLKLQTAVVQFGHAQDGERILPGREGDVRILKVGYFLFVCGAELHVHEGFLSCRDIRRGNHLNVAGRHVAGNGYGKVRVAGGNHLLQIHIDHIATGVVIDIAAVVKHRTA